MKLSGHLLLLTSLLCACGHTKTAASSAAHTAEAREEPTLLALHMQNVALELKSEGFSESDVSLRGFLPPGERRTERLEVPANTCFVFVGLGSAGIGDLDLALYTPDGEVVVDDDKADARPVISACNGGQQRALYLRLLAYQGGGAFLTAMFVRPIRTEDRALALSAEGTRDALFELSRTLNKRGFVERADPITLPLGEAQELRVATPSEAGHCYAALIEPSGGLLALSVRVLDEHDQELANGVVDGAASGLQWCSRKSGDASLLLSAMKGGGTVRVLRFSGNEAVIGGSNALWLGEPSPSPAYWAAKSTTADSKNPSGAFLEGKGSLSQGRMEDIALAARTAPCERYDVQLERGVALATVSLVSDTGELLASAEGGPPMLTMRVCKRQGPAHLTLVARKGFGPFVVTGRAD